MNLSKGQLTARGLVIGLTGCIVITASSVYIALKMGALPWPIVLAAMLSIFFLKALGKANLNEANVTHTIMSAGAMVGGGLAFTIPGIWILGWGDAVSWWQMLLVALCGTVLGLLFTALLRKHFIEDEGLEYPMGQAAAMTLVASSGASTVEEALGSCSSCAAAVEEGMEITSACSAVEAECDAAEQRHATISGGENQFEDRIDSSDAGGRIGLKLFGSMGFAGLYAILRDGLALVPSLVGVTGPAGVFLGVFNSPMMLAVGFMVGIPAIVSWLIGGLVGDGLVVMGGTAVGLWDAVAAAGIKSSLGMGLMMGCGIAIVLKDVLLPICRSAKNRVVAQEDSGASVFSNEADRSYRGTMNLPVGVVALALAAVGLIACFALQLGVVPALIIVAFAWVTCAMAAQSVGQSGIDPMEVFGLIVLLIVAVCADVPQVQLLFVAAIIAVACGLAGDVMNDFKAGHMLGTDPGAQWLGQAVGSLVGAFVAVTVMCLLVAAYGPESFGIGKLFISAQANAVATMIAGIPNIPAFAVGLAVGAALYAAGLPGMMFGLGVYLPLYYALTVALGMIVRFTWDAWTRSKSTGLSSEAKAMMFARRDRDGLIIASGMLGGESVVGVAFAIVTVIAALLA